MDDPFKKMMTELRDEILSGVRDLLKEQRVQGAESSELDPFELYESTGAAEFLGIDRSTLYDIPETELPRCRVGPARGSTRWMGADLLAYARGLDPIDYKSVLDELREELRRRPGTTADRIDESNRVL
jgi:hypothetical protein